MCSVCKHHILIETCWGQEPATLALPSFPQGTHPREWGMGRPLRMAPTGPTLLDEVPLLPCLLLCELYLLEQSVQVHSWLLQGPVGSVSCALCEGPTARPSGPGQSLGHGEGTQDTQGGDTAEGTH